jgi:hypothetical protein
MEVKRWDTQAIYTEMKRTQIFFTKVLNGLPYKQGWAAPSLPIAATTMSSCITTAHNLTMRSGGSVGH